jgi:4'-phosphopantetheinyl transferase
VAGPWQRRYSPPPLVPGEAHVWRVDLGPALSVPAESGILSGEERDRAAHFHRPADRARSIAARAGLRELLAGYVGAAPEALRFTAGPHGKPALEPGIAAAAPRFNVAHSGRLILLAFAACDVGVDVEEMRVGVEVEELARRFFSADETGALAAAPPLERDRVFFRIWTRKEAFLKSHGTGLSSPLTAFTTTSRSGAPLASIGAVGGLPSGFLSDLDPADGYTGAVVTVEPARVVMMDLAEITE